MRLSHRASTFAAGRPLPQPDRPLRGSHAEYWLFDYRGNRYIDAVGADDFDDESYLPTIDTATELYRERRQAAQRALDAIRAFPGMQNLMTEMPAWMTSGWRSPVRLAHELDYRSRLLNNEMGFFFTGDFFNEDGLLADLRRDADELKQQALPWGSPQWLQLRRDVAATGSVKGAATRNQRFIYKALVGLGLVWQF